MREEEKRVAMIKSSLLADLLEVPSKKRGKTLRVRLAAFYAALCLRPLGLLSFRRVSFYFIFGSIDSPFPALRVIPHDCTNFGIESRQFLNAPRNYETVSV